MYVEANEWDVTDVEVVQPHPSPDLEPTLHDIESRMPRGHSYRDGRHITWAHETTHGLNARIRNQQVYMLVVPSDYVTSAADGEIIALSPNRRITVPVPAEMHKASIEGRPAMAWSEKNAFYVLGGQAFRAHEPALKLADVANAVPRDLKGMAFQLYLRDQQRWWNDQPLYVWDEWSAYLNGLATALDGAPDGSFSDVLQALEFFVYGTVLFGQIQGNIVKPYSETSSTRELGSFVRFQAERTASMYLQSKSTSLDSTRQTDYIRRIFRSDGFTLYRHTLNSLFGEEWLETIFNW